MAPKIIATHIYGLHLELKGDKMAIIICGTKKHWVDIPEAAKNDLTNMFDSHFKKIEEEKKLTHQQLAERYAEYGGS